MNATPLLSPRAPEMPPDRAVPRTLEADTSRATLPATMKTIVRERYGSAEVLELKDIPVPHVGAGEVLVRVAAAGLGRGVWHLMRGRPYLARLAYGIRKPKNAQLGLELAGTVARVGEGVVGFAPGDRVFGFARGAFAEYAAARADKLAHLPEGIPFEVAAAVPDSGVTALQALRDHGRVRPGERVLVLGASGGVGTFAVPLAKHFGATVTGAASAAKLDLVRELGADDVRDYAETDLGGPYDLVLAVGGSLPLGQLRRLLAERGTLVIVGGESRTMMRRLLGAALKAPFVRRRRIVTLVASENRRDLATLLGLLSAGALRPTLDSVRPITRLPEAMRDLEAGRVCGKVILEVAPPSAAAPHSHSPAHTAPRTAPADPSAGP
ncbi:NAD(P)-dependent alcohol dehydrogenase [Truepera radiovictrix]|uniref:NAD(P)-dependent alcohol dehydrogenase n=1 Tax=Truepera radiovictrix TaxID=332249 RepID=UPI001C88ACF2|nr:NAD(P)-dependent alcohol dehydrogenase [Truepera radiovictrix]